jgi:repressor LexA
MLADNAVTLKPLTGKQQAMLDFIRGFIAREHFPPSYEEIRAGLGLSTKSLVDYHLGRIEAAGYITRQSRTSRTIQIITRD